MPVLFKASSLLAEDRKQDHKTGRGILCSCKEENGKRGKWQNVFVTYLGKNPQPWNGLSHWAPSSNSQMSDWLKNACLENNKY